MESTMGRFVEMVNGFRKKDGQLGFNIPLIELMLIVATTIFTVMSFLNHVETIKDT